MSDDRLYRERHDDIHKQYATCLFLRLHYYAELVKARQEIERLKRELAAARSAVTSRNADGQDDVSP